MDPGFDILDRIEQAIFYDEQLEELYREDDFARFAREYGTGGNADEPELLTTDAGEPIVHLKGARELGHRDTAMVAEIYGHMGSGVTQFRRRPYVPLELSDYAAAPNGHPDVTFMRCALIVIRFRFSSSPRAAGRYLNSDPMQSM